LKAQATGLEREADAEYAELVRAREPILQDMLQTLADELASLEAEAATLRARLFGFSTCGVSAVRVRAAHGGKPRPDPFPGL
jgi:hypothetical protein